MNPTKIILNRKQKLIDITYSDGVNYKISAELLDELFGGSTQIPLT